MNNFPQIEHSDLDVIVEGVVPETSIFPRLAWMNLYEESGSAKEVCRRFGISRKTFYKWLKRYQSSNHDATSLKDRSRRPHRSPRSTPEAIIGLIRRLHDETGFGQRRLRAHLLEYHRISLSERTIWKLLKRPGTA